MTEPYVGSASRPAWTARVRKSLMRASSRERLEEVGPRQDPGRSALVGDQERLAVAYQQLDRLANGVAGRHRGEGRLHDVDDLGVEHRRVVDRVLEQPALADRADDAR